MEKENIPAALLTLTAGVLVALISLWVVLNHHLMPEQASEQAPLVDGFFNLLLAVGTSLFLVVEGAIFLSVVRFRQRPGDRTDAEPITGNLPLEAFWTAIPAIIVIVIGIYSVEVYRNMGGFDAFAHHHGGAEMEMAAAPTEAVPLENQYGVGAAPTRETSPPDLTVDVAAMQFAWIFTYPDEVVAGELHLPLGKDVLLNLNAQDVIHSFWVPQFRLKQDVIPGQATQLRFVATKAGTYPLVCAELCGGYHGAMRAEVIVQPEAEFEAWLAENRLASQPAVTETIAINPAELTPADFLAPYAQTLGVDGAALASLDPQFSQK